MAASTKKPTTDRLLAALGHPLRRSILRAMEGGPASPAELAGGLDAPLPTISYHVRVLYKCGALELAHTRAVRGAVEHFYRSLVKAEWALTALEESRREDGG